MSVFRLQEHFSDSNIEKRALLLLAFVLYLFFWMSCWFGSLSLVISNNELMLSQDQYFSICFNGTPWQWRIRLRWLKPALCYMIFSTDLLSRAQLYIIKVNVWSEVEISDLRIHNATWCRCDQRQMTTKFRQGWNISNLHVRS